MTMSPGKGTSFETRAIPVEQIVSLQPFVVRRRIAFGDCDPAGIVYTPRFLDPISTGAVDLFMQELVGTFGTRDKPVGGIDTPAKAINLVFHSPSRHRDLIDLELYCSRIGNSTFDITVEARAQDGKKLFDCTMTLICVDPAAYTSVPVPEFLSEKLQSQCKKPPAT